MSDKPNTNNDADTFGRYDLLGKREWEHGIIPFRYNPAGALLPTDQMEAIIADVVLLLNSFSNLELRYEGLSDKPLNMKEADEEVTVGWMDTTWYHPGEVLALTMMMGTPSAWISDCELAFNTTYDGFRPDNPHHATRLMYTLIHELLHIAGIGHGAVMHSVMLPGQSKVEGFPLWLAPADQTVLEYKYPSNIPEPKIALDTRPICWLFPDDDPRRNQSGDRSIFIPALRWRGKKELIYARLDPIGAQKYGGDWFAKYKVAYTGQLKDWIEGFDKYYCTDVSEGEVGKVMLKDVWLGAAGVCKEARLYHWQDNEWLLMYYKM